MKNILNLIYQLNNSMMMVIFSTPWPEISALTRSWGCWEKMFDPLSSSWWMSLTCNNNSLISPLHSAERWRRVVASAASSSRNSSFLKRELHTNKLLSLMKDSGSDCLAVRQIKLQKRSAEWADRRETLLCLHEERSEHSLKLRKQDQRNKWRSISPEEVLQAYRDVQKV